MAELYFLVSKFPNEETPTDIAFIPVNKGPIHKEYLKFKSDVEIVVSTIKALFNKDKASLAQFFDKVFFASELCFSGDKNDLITASQALDDIKNELTSSYWMKVRSEILVKYGKASLIISLILYAVSFLVSKDYFFFFVSLLGTCVGSWLSLAIRTKQLVFEDVRQHISEVISPFIRCIFACVLSFTCLILLKVGIVEIKLGSISTLQIADKLEMALAIGILFGFGEKYLISTINGKSEKAFA